MESAASLASAALAVAVIAILTAIWALVSAARARRQLVVFRGQASEADVLAALSENANRQEDLVNRVMRLNNAVALCQRDVAASLRHLSVVRFNALGEMGGQFSFSAAILDDEANGIVITSIQGRTQGRIYAKTVLAGTSEQLLTPEEQEAIAAARPEGLR